MLQRQKKALIVYNFVTHHKGDILEKNITCIGRSW
jgi:hypothetical protein